MVAPVHRVAPHVLERVVHPAHVPLHREAEPAGVDRARDHRPRRRFLGDRHRAGEAAVHEGVHVAHEIDRLEILASAVAVGNPFAGGTRVVEIEHRGDSVDAQAVEVELGQPVACRGEQERAHLRPAVVEHVRAPVGMASDAGVGVLVERRAVEVREREGVAGKVSRHPVEDHAEARLVAAVDERAEVVGRAVARRRREVAGGLVAPRLVERMLGDRHQFDVREAQVGGVGHEPVGKLAPVVEAPVGMAHPRTRVDLVDVDRRALEVPRGPAREPFAVAPAVGTVRHHARGRRRPQLERAPVRIALHEHQPGVAVTELELVERASLEPGHEQLPHAARTPRVERMRAAVPAVEVADQGDSLGIGRPHGEAHAGNAGERHRHRTQHAPGLEQPALVEEVQVEVADRRREAVGIDELGPATLGLGDEPVRRRRRRGETRDEQVAGTVAGERHRTVIGPEPHSRRRGPEGAVDEGRAVAMQSEEGARIVQARREKAFARTAFGRRGIGRFHDRIIVSVFGPGVPERRTAARRA